MCWCDPNLRTPQCGKLTCLPPAPAAGDMAFDPPDPRLDPHALLARIERLERRMNDAAWHGVEEPGR